MLCSCYRKFQSRRRCLQIYTLSVLRLKFKHALHVCVHVRGRKGKNQVCWCHTNLYLDRLSQVPLIPASLVSNMRGVQKMLLSVTSFWQHAQVQHPARSPQIYQWSQMPLDVGRAWGVVAALSGKPYSPTRPSFNDPETAAGSQFSSVPRESLRRMSASHGAIPTPSWTVQTRGQGVSNSFV